MGVCVTPVNTNLYAFCTKNYPIVYNTRELSSDEQTLLLFFRCTQQKSGLMTFHVWSSSTDQI